MPIYGFECAACGHSFDRLQKMSDPDPETCPDCGAASIKRQLTAPSFRLSGSGWYETDFKKDSDKKRNLTGEGGEGAKAGDKTGEKADGKADKPAAAKPDASSPAESKPKPASKPAGSPKSDSKPASG